MSYLFASLVALFFGLGLYLLGPPIRRFVVRRAVRAYRQPVPAVWTRAVENRVAAVRALTEPQRERLMRAARDLIAGCDWEGCGGLALTPDMQLVIAAQACLLTLELPGEAYPGLRTVLVYPSAFLAKAAPDPRKWVRGTVPEPPVAELGEAWSEGNVVVAWDAAMLGGEDASDGHNVVIHEFAHLIDFQFQLTQPGNTRAASSAWRRVLQESYDRHCVAVVNHATSVLDPYGATNPAEFFAVVTEAFFERPGALRNEYPDLYRELCGIFRQDPAAASPLQPRAPSPA